MLGKPLLYQWIIFGGLLDIAVGKLFARKMYVKRRRRKRMRFPTSRPENVKFANALKI
jgi:hypothetical protein